VRLAAALLLAASNAVLPRFIDAHIENDGIGHPRSVGGLQKRRSRRPVRRPPHRCYPSVHVAPAAAPSSVTMRFSLPLRPKMLALHDSLRAF